MSLLCVWILFYDANSRSCFRRFLLSAIIAVQRNSVSSVLCSHGDLVGIYMLQIPAYPEVILTGDLVGLYMLQIPAYPEVILT